MLRYIYERLLEREVSRDVIPQCVALVLSAGDLQGKGIHILSSLLEWIEPLGVKCLLIYIAEEGGELEDRITQELQGSRAEISIHTKDDVKHLGRGDLQLVISLGYGGKREVAQAVAEVLREVERGIVKPVEIDERMIEARLRFAQRPDLVIRAGGKQLSDFMIWQAAYSELYFTEVNWSSLRRIDLLRAIRDFQKRERRFGK